jgi:hypothetical protein
VEISHCKIRIHTLNALVRVQPLENLVQASFVVKPCVMITAAMPQLVGSFQSFGILSMFGDVRLLGPVSTIGRELGFVFVGTTVQQL